MKTTGGNGIQLEDMGDLSKLGVDRVPGNGHVVLESVGELERPLGAAEQLNAQRHEDRPRLEARRHIHGQAAGRPAPPARKSNGDLSSSSRLTDEFDEGTDEEPNLADFVPVDEFDFAEFKTPDGTPMAEGRYARDTNTDERMTYPGFSVPLPPELEPLTVAPPPPTPPQKPKPTELPDPAVDPAVILSNLGEKSDPTYHRTVRLPLHMMAGTNTISGGNATATPSAGSPTPAT